MIVDALCAVALVSAKGANSLPAWGGAPGGHSKKSSSAESVFHVGPQLIWNQNRIHRIEARLQRLLSGCAIESLGRCPRLEDETTPLALTRFMSPRRRDFRG